MREIMEQACFPRDAVEDLLEKEELLKEKGCWEVLMQLAEETMEGYPEKNLLNDNLKKAAEWETKTEVSRYTLELFLILRCWEIVRGKYEEKGISMEIYQDTLKDITYKLLECRDVYGINGTFVGEWYGGFFDMTRFALGRLQFEIMPYRGEEEFSQNGVTVKKGDKVINMHIPSCGPLKKEDVEAALDQATAFFEKEFSGKKPAFVMASWLLDKDLMNLLPEGNIKEFVNRFTVLTARKNPTFVDGWRVFGSEWTEKYEELPRRTRLQRAIGDYLQQGGTLGDGYGIFVR